LRGHSGYSKYMADWLSTWGEYEWKSRELIDLGDRIVVLASIVGHGHGSGAPIGQTLSAVWTLKDGEVVRHEECLSDAEALETVGLQE
jgi:hypothetical protein